MPILETTFSWRRLCHGLMTAGLTCALISGLTACRPKTEPADEATPKTASGKANPQSNKTRQNKKQAQSLPGSSGKTCEIIVVCQKPYYEGLFRDSLQQFFMEAQPLLNQGEPRFTLANIQPEAFRDNPMFMHHRNIIGIEIDTAFRKEPVVEMSADRWALPQIVFWFKVADSRQFDSLFDRYKAFMRHNIYEKEYERIQRVFKKSENIDLSRHIEKNYGFSLIFPDGFSLASSKKDFAWIRKESKHAGQGIVFQTYPYTDAETFTLSHILKKRNEMVANIPGPLDGSFMTTETGYPDVYPESRPIQIDGRYAVETRGLWKLEGDFMGGPFVNYVLVDTAQNRVLMMDAYLYSPRKPKRDLLIQLEAIARGLKFL